MYIFNNAWQPIFSQLYSNWRLVFNFAKCRAIHQKLGPNRRWHFSMTFPIINADKCGFVFVTRIRSKPYLAHFAVVIQLEKLNTQIMLIPCLSTFDWICRANVPIYQSWWNFMGPLWRFRFACNGRNRKDLHIKQNNRPNPVFHVNRSNIAKHTTRIYDYNDFSITWRLELYWLAKGRKFTTINKCWPLLINYLISIISAIFYRCATDTQVVIEQLKSHTWCFWGRENWVILRFWDSRIITLLGHGYQGLPDFVIRKVRQRSPRISVFASLTKLSDKINKKLYSQPIKRVRIFQLMDMGLNLLIYIATIE